MNLYSLWVYFRRGHSTYLALGVSLVNFITIQYALLVQRSSLLSGVFTSFEVFASASMIVYCLVASAVGWFDMRKGALGTEQAIQAEASPYHRDMADFNVILCNQLEALGASRAEMDRARGLMRRWRN